MEQDSSYAHLPGICFPLPNEYNLQVMLVNRYGVETAERPLRGASASRSGDSIRQHAEGGKETLAQRVNKSQHFKPFSWK